MEWRYTPDPIDYKTALEQMQSRVKRIHLLQQSELIWGLQHSPVFTGGTSAHPKDLLNSFGFPVHYVGRGGQFTYHGPGQLIIYAMVNLVKRNLDIKQYILLLQQWIIDTLSHLNIKSVIHQDRIGVWVHNFEGKEEKLAAVGVRVSHGITWHGFSVNVSPNLDHFKGIIPCGLHNFGITSLEKMNVKIKLEDLFKILKKFFPFEDC